MILVATSCSECSTVVFNGTSLALQKVYETWKFVILSTLLSRELTSLDHFAFSITHTELVVVISVSKPSLFKSLWPSSMGVINSMKRLSSPSLSILNCFISSMMISTTLAGSPYFSSKRCYISSMSSSTLFTNLAGSPSRQLRETYAASLFRV